MLNRTLLLSVLTILGLDFDDHAAKMLIPGAVTSGLITSCPAIFGPLEENAAIIGAMLPYLVPRNEIEAVGFLVVLR